MLILSRKVGQSVFIGGPEISVTILQVHGTQVRIGFSAPDNVEIHREEVFERMRAEKADGSAPKTNKMTK